MFTDEFGPLDYPWWWFAIGLALLLGVLGWFIYLGLSTRKPRPPKVRSTSARRDPWAAARRSHLAQIDQVAARYEAGQLDLRDLHTALSMQVRSFAHARAGLDATYLALSELSSRPELAHIAPLIARYYQPEFAAEPDADPHASIEQAREVIATW